MIKNLLITITLLFSINVLANTQDDTMSIYLGGWSKHFDNDYDYNESNQLIAIQYNEYVFGTFKTSYYNRGYVAGYDMGYDWQDLRFGILVGAVYGYTEYEIDPHLLIGDKLVPLIFPYVSYIKFKIKPVVGVLGEAVTLQFKLSF